MLFFSLHWYVMTEKNQFEPLKVKLKRLKQSEGNPKPNPKTVVVDDTDFDVAKFDEWLRGAYAKKMKFLREQEDYFIAILSEFEKGNRDEVRSLFKAHPNQDEFFLFVLDYLEDPKAKASETAELRHARLEPYRQRARRMYLEVKEQDSRVTQEKFAVAFIELMQEEFDANELEMLQLKEEISSQKEKLHNEINRQYKPQLRKELEELKGKLSLMKLHPKPPKKKAIASWLTAKNISSLPSRRDD